MFAAKQQSVLLLDGSSCNAITFIGKSCGKAERIFEIERYLEYKSTDLMVEIISSCLIHSLPLQVPFPIVGEVEISQ